MSCVLETSWYYFFRSVILETAYYYSFPFPKVIASYSHWGKFPSGSQGSVVSLTVKKIAIDTDLPALCPDIFLSGETP